MHLHFSKLAEYLIENDLIIKNIPESTLSDDSLRPLFWKIFLKYLPTNISFWKDRLEEQRKNYKNLIKLYTGARSSELDCDPLSKSGNYSKYLEDNEVLCQINKDCIRLFPDSQFFKEFTEYPFKTVFENISDSNTIRNRIKKYHVETSHDVNIDICGTTVLKDKSKKKIDLTYDPNSEFHWEVIQRILFIHYKTKDLKYYQEMCEIIAPIYYVFYNDTDLEWKCHVEADTYFCFANLIDEIKANFEKNYTPTSNGIGSKMLSVPIVLEYFDFELNQDFLRKDLKMEYFCYRWISLLLAQEFSLDAIIKIWSSLFLDCDRFDLLIFFCVAMLILDRENLLRLDFSQSLVRLQHYPPVDEDELIQFAKRLHTDKLKIFTSQNDKLRREIMTSAFEFLKS